MVNDMRKYNKRYTLEEYYAAYMYEKDLKKVTPDEVKRAMYVLYRNYVEVWNDGTLTRKERVAKIIEDLNDFYEMFPNAPKSLRTFYRFFERAEKEFNGNGKENNKNKKSLLSRLFKSFNIF